MLILAIFGVMLILMLLRVFLVFGTKIEGERLGEIKLGFREKLLLQRTNIYLVGFLLLVAAFNGALPGYWELLIILAVFAVVGMPARYTLTSKGIAFNNVVFRPWTEFRSVQVTKRGLHLVPREKVRPFDVVVLGKQRDEAARAIGRFIQSGASRDAGRAITFSDSPAQPRPRGKRVREESQSAQVAKEA